MNKIFIITVCLFISSLSIYSQDAKAFTRVYDRLDYFEQETREWIIVGTDMSIVVEFNYLNYFNKIPLASESRDSKKPSESLIFEFDKKLYKYGTLQAKQK